jgi:formamidopyrimidine-DNA glycosylase
MPELPEIETILRTLAPVLVGRRIDAVEVRSPALRKPIPADLARTLEGRRVRRLARRGKFLLVDLGLAPQWILHMGMSGRLCHHLEVPALDRHDHVVVTLEDRSVLVLRDPRRFGLCILEEPAASPWLARMGPEPLDPAAFTAEGFAAVARRSRRAVKEVLLDQRVVAGVGNIYASEALFVAGVRPRRRGISLTHPQCARIVEAVREILTEAIEHRGTTMADFLDGIGRRGGYQWRRRVYDRAGEPCVVCATPIRSVVIGQRSSFYCSGCQR